MSQHDACLCSLSGSEDLLVVALECPAHGDRALEAYEHLSRDLTRFAWLLEDHDIETWQRESLLAEAKEFEQLILDIDGLETFDPREAA